MFTLPPLPNIEPQVEGARWALNANDTGISGRVLTHLAGHQKGKLTTGARGQDFKKVALGVNPNGSFHVTLAGGWSAYIQQDGSVLLARSHGITSTVFPWVLRLPHRRLKTAPTDTYRGLDATVRHLAPYEGPLHVGAFNPDEMTAPMMVQTPIKDQHDDVFAMPTPLLGAVVQTLFSNFFDPKSRLVSSDLELDSAILDAGHPDLYAIPRFRLKGIISYIPENTQIVRQTEHNLRQLVASDPKLFLGPDSFGQKFGEHNYSGSNWSVEPSFKFIQKLHPQAKQTFSNHLMVQAEKICRDHGLQKIIAKTT